MVVVTFPAGDPSESVTGELSGDLSDGGSSDGSELKSSVGTSSDGLVTRDSVGEDGEVLSSSDGGQDGEKSCRRRDHCCVGVVVLIFQARMSSSIYR